MSREIMESKNQENPFRFFLGGRDLEMQAIQQTLENAGLRESIEDDGLTWGARASAYTTRIRETLAKGVRPVLVELVDDLPRDIDRRALVIIDHHGARAGANAPSSLRQIHRLLGNLPWTRGDSLIEANDVGHIAGLRAARANAEEIRAIRDVDRRAQGVTADDEAKAREAIARGQWSGPLFVVESASLRTSPISDFLHREYGGPGVDHLLIVTPRTLEFYGAGAVVQALSSHPGCWWGGALPDRGFWGAPRDGMNLADAMAQILGVLGRQSR